MTSNHQENHPRMILDCGVGSLVTNHPMFIVDYRIDAENRNHHSISVAPWLISMALPRISVGSSNDGAAEVTNRNARLRTEEQD